MKAKAAGIESHALGSRVPVHSKLCGNSRLISQETTFGTRPPRRSGAAHNKPQLRGTKYHLCRLATYQSAAMAEMSKRTLPGTCAPSTRTAVPRSRQIRVISAIGRTSAVLEVTWSRMASLVRDVSAACNAARQRAGLGFGNGIGMRTTVAAY